MSGQPFTVLRNGYDTEGYTGQLGEYLEAGEIVGAAGHGRILAAPRRDEATAQFVAALDASIARGDLETRSQDLAQLLGRPATPLTDAVGAAHDAVPNAARDRREH